MQTIAVCFKEEVDVPAEPWSLHPDRALPADPVVRRIAGEIYRSTAELPLVSMHGHIDARLLDENLPFPDPAALLVIPDHYLVRMLVSQGAANQQLGVCPRVQQPGIVVERDHREVWRRFAANWRLFRGTPTRYWLEHELVEVFGVTVRPSAETADQIYDHLLDVLARPEFLPRALFERFNLEILATTDAASADLAHHASLARQGWGGRVVPTFRPDTVVDLARSDWAEQIRLLSKVAQIDVGDYDSFLRALEQRRAAFLAAGALASDHGHLSVDCTPLDRGEARRIFADALRGRVTAEQAVAFSGHMLFEFARMSCDDGIVMQLHPGVMRDHDAAIARVFGPDKGFDIPVQTEFTRALRPMLEAFGRDHGFRLVLFTTDETVYSRELAPLAGVYPSVRLGAPWWFLDSPDGMRRFRDLVTETAGFYNTTGFVDDTRAFASIPARHDLARRIDAGYLARLVAEHRLELDEAVETAADLAYHLPVQSYAPRP